MSIETKYEKLSNLRKTLQEQGEAPEWYTTAGFQLATEQRYLAPDETPLGMYRRQAKRAAELTTVPIPDDWGFENWEDAFFQVIWKGWVSPASPTLINFGNDRGHPVSCSGTHLGDSIRSWYEARLEMSQLTQRGYGTSTVIGDARHRGSPISTGGTANGVMQPAAGIVQDMKDVSQGSSRRGAAGLYIDPLHPDFDEVADQILSDDAGWNIGWNITDEFEDLFNTDPESADRIWKKMLRIKLIKGKGYFFFIDKANRSRPRMYKDKGFLIKGSNLCCEIQLMSDEDHSFTCVLASMNVSKYNEWKDTKAVEIATVFLDAIISDMLIKAKGEKGFERVVNFTEKSRAIGLGILGEATYYQQEGWVFGDLSSIMFNQLLVKQLDDRTLEVSQWLAREVGEPEWMVGYGERFSHRLAFPPTMSTSIIMGGISQGIEPVFANVYEQDTAGGTVFRINPPFLELMKKRGMNSPEVIERIAEDKGSVQGESWLTQHEKDIFRTAFEISPYSILKMSGDRQRNMNKSGGGQGQSTNLYFPHDALEEEISEVHDAAFRDPDIESLYYIRTLNGKTKVKIDRSTCVACEG